MTSDARGSSFVLALFASAFALSTLVGCSAPGSNNPAPLTTNGEELFALKAIGGSAGCVTCHSLTPDHVLVGPSLAGVADRAGGRVEGMNADQYLRRSIVAPADYVVGTFDADKMPSNYADILSDEQLDALVSYLKAAT